MRIYYTASTGSTSPQVDELATRTIPALLLELGHSVEVEIYNPNRPEQKTGFDTIARRIIEADLFIGEMSRASQTLGFKLAYALMNTKPTLYLYHKDRRARPGPALSENPSRLLKIKAYDTQSIKPTLERFLAFAEQQQNSTRTSFMSTRRIDEFLTGRAKQLGTTKGEVIRQILDRASEEL